MALFLLLLLLLSVRGSPSQEMQCPSLRTAALSFSVASSRNQTGHRIAQVMLKHGAQTEADSGAWQIDVDQNTVICDGVESVNIVATVTAPPTRPGPDYELFPGLGYYKLHTTPRTWEEAWRSCAFEGGHLAIVNSETEARVLQMMFARNPKIVGSTQNDYAFLGAHDMFSEGQFTTIFAGDPLNKTGYWNWAKGQPSKNTSSNCVIFHRMEATYYDKPCTWKLAAFCEQELY
uniref:Putative LPSBP2 isoform A n=1 Tax=Reticulitermes speratus TaxID=60591 RepID=A0A1V1FIQ9_9NEOP